MTATALKINDKTLNTQLDQAGRGRIYNNILETIGNTPLVKLDRMAKTANAKAEVLLKLEFFNPLSSIKDRIALSMVEAAEAAGKLNKNTILVEPTSGNTGIALAYVAAAKGYKIILTMPESMSIERRKMLKLLGAELHLTPAAAGMKGAIEKAQEIVDSNSNAIMLQQFKNEANPAIHRITTAEEIWVDTDGKLDVFITGVGTGGSLTGIGGLLKEKDANIKVMAVEPEASPVLSGGQAGPHKIQGIGAGFIPEVLDTKLIDEVITINNETAFKIARDMAAIEGIPVGISSGATVAAALEVAARDEMAGKRIVVIVASTAERYISTDLFASLEA